MAKTKFSLEIIKDVNKCITWKWYTVAKSQAKTQPPFNAVDTEQHYQQMQNDIHATAEKNPVFRNMVMRILVDITKEDMDDTIQTAGHVVTIFNFIANKVSNNSCHCSSCGASSDTLPDTSH